MQQRKYIVRLYLCLLFFSACSDNNDLSFDSELVRIVVSTGFGSISGVESRARGTITAEDILGGNPLSLSVVRIDQSDADGGAYSPYTQENASDGSGQAPRDATLSGNNNDLLVNFDTEAYFLPRDNEYNYTKLIAWYPQVGTQGSVWQVEENGGAPNATVTFEVDGKTDILMSNLVEGNIQHRFDGAENTMVFNHLLTRFYIRVFTRSTVAAGAWGGVTDVSLKAQPQFCKVRLPGVDDATGTIPSDITFTGSSQVPILLDQPGTPVPVPIVSGETDEKGFLIGTASVGYVMVAPQTTAFELNITNETLKGVVQVTPPSGGFLAGHSYTLSLEYVGREINLSEVIINEWVMGEGEEIIIG